MSFNVIGANLSHDASFCLLQDGRITSAIALERTTRLKRGIVPHHLFSSFARNTIMELLDVAGLSLHDVDLWAVNSTEVSSADQSLGLYDILGLSIPRDRQVVIPHPGHHLIHAVGAFHASGFDNARVIVIDTYGSRLDKAREQETIFEFTDGGHPQVLWRSLKPGVEITGTMNDGVYSYHRSISGVGEVYRTGTLALGFATGGMGQYDDAGKTMGASGYGTLISQDPMFVAVKGGELDFSGAMDAFTSLGYMKKVDDKYILLPRQGRSELSDQDFNLAAQLQHELEISCQQLVTRATEGGDYPVVCTGGAFLNCISNRKIAEQLDVPSYYFPVATDDGNAIGAAYYAYHYYRQAALGNEGAGAVANSAAQKAMASSVAARESRLNSLFLGPERPLTCDAAAFLKKLNVGFKTHEGEFAVANAIASQIASGLIVAVCRGRSEFGPRALGARSIVCHPGLPGMKDEVNRRVKFRESFRPFAAAVLGRCLDDYFIAPDCDHRFMNTSAITRPEKVSGLTEVTHVDGSCRVQTVSNGDPFFNILEALEEITGVPVLLNTSLNVKGEPIVETAEEAINCFLKCSIDSIFVGNLEVNMRDLTSLAVKRSAAGEIDSSDLLEQFETKSCFGLRLDVVAERLSMTFEELIDECRRLRHIEKIQFEGEQQREIWLPKQYAED